MQVALQHLGLLQSDPLAAVCFALGVAGLLFAFRRTIFRSRHQPDAVLPELESRFSNAHRQIERIAEREIFQKLQQGYRFRRTGRPLTSADQQTLDRLATEQAHGVNSDG